MVHAFRLSGSTTMGDCLPASVSSASAPGTMMELSDLCSALCSAKNVTNT